MASIAASLRRVMATGARQSHSKVCHSTIRTTLAPRPFSSCQSPRAEMDTGSQAGMNSQAGQSVEVLERVAHREPPEGDPDNIVEKEWEFDDFSSMAHAELERHREARQYARIMAYEMPRLSELVKPFVPPNEKEIIRFRYTTYMGEKHPAQSKVVCEFATSDLPLTKVERNKLIKLVGVRYNPDTDIVRMSSEMFQHQAQNKRYLSDLVDSLIVEAKDSSETFEDIPFDFRHHEAKKPPPKPKFPKEWRLNPERRTQLQEERVNLERMFEQ